MEPRLESTRFAFVLIYQGSVTLGQLKTAGLARMHKQGLQIPLLLSLAGAALQAALRMENRLPRGLRQESRLLPFTYPGKISFL